MFEAIPQADLSPESIDRLDQRTTECATAFARKVEKLQGLVIDAAARFRRERQPMIDNADSTDRELVRQIVERDAERSANEYRRELVKSSEKERDDVLSALRKHENELQAFAELCTSPAQMLGRVGLGDPRRTQIQLQLQGAGPVELTTAAKEAVARRDLVAGAAIMTVVDRLPKKDRPFSPAEFADALMGAQHKALTAKLDAARERIAATRDLDRAFALGKSDPTSRIQRGLAARRASK